MPAARRTRSRRKLLKCWVREHGFPERRFAAVAARAATTDARGPVGPAPAACTVAPERAWSWRGTIGALDRRPGLVRIGRATPVRRLRLVSIAARRQPSGLSRGAH